MREPLVGKVQQRPAGRGSFRVLGDAGSPSKRNLSPSVVASRCLALLSSKSAEWTGTSIDDKSNVILGRLHDERWMDPCEGEALEANILSLCSPRNPKPLPPEQILAQVASLAAAFCVQAIKASAFDETSHAWTYASRAEHYVGVATGISFQTRAFRGKSISDFARKGADARHVNNRLMREIVADYYERNMSAYESIDAAAEAIADRIVDAKFVTVRRVIKLHRRKMREAGRL